MLTDPVCAGNLNLKTEIKFKEKNIMSNEKSSLELRRADYFTPF